MSGVAIIGTGLIGTSIALGLRRDPATAGLPIIGSDIAREYARAANARGCFDRVIGDPRAAVADASLVVLAVPVLAIREVLEDLAPVLLEGVVVTDTGSTKSQVMRWAAELLPPTAHFIGSHPMAGKTEFGPDAAEAGLFQDARWVLVPSREAPHEAIETVRGLALTLGAHPMFMDAEEHDSYVAAISHLPMVAAQALFKLARTSEAWPELSLLASSGFRDTTRLTGTDDQMALDILRTNRAPVLHWLDRYSAELAKLRELIAETAREDALREFLAEIELDYAAYRAGVVGRREVDEQSAVSDVTAKQLMLGMMLGDRATQFIESGGTFEDGSAPGGKIRGDDRADGRGDDRGGRGGLFRRRGR